MSGTETPLVPKLSPAERLLESADRLFYAKGYAATGVNELLEDSGVAKASFYLHFRSKTDLIVAYLRHRNETWFQALDAALDKHESAASRLLAVFDFTAEMLAANNFRGCAFLNTLAEFNDPISPPRSVVSEHKQSMREYMARLAEQAGVPDAADELFLLLEGAVSQVAVGAELWPLEVARRSAQQRLDLL